MSRRMTLSIPLLNQLQLPYPAVVCAALSLLPPSPHRLMLHPLTLLSHRKPTLASCHLAPAD